MWGDRMDDPVYRDLLADVAEMYYTQEMTQNEIGAALGVSRVKVHRLLKEARDTGVVQITVLRVRPRNERLECELKERFGLDDVLVLAAGEAEVGIWRSIGEMTARYIEKLLKDDTTIAVCLGRSTYEVVQAIRPGSHARVRIAQASGSIPFVVEEMDSLMIARQLGKKLGGDVLYLPSPMIADSPEAAIILRRQQDIERTLSAAGAADLALVGIGNLDVNLSPLISAAGLNSEQVEAMKQAGAVGDIAGQVFTGEGRLCLNGLSGRTIGLTLDELKRIPKVIAVAFGLAKARAILGALRTGVVDVLSTDDRTAGEILQLDKNALQGGGG
jgi:deoxyribonucleoside regulator